MVLATSRYNAAYFGDTVESGGIKDLNGYSSYLELGGQRNRFDIGDESNPYNLTWKLRTTEIGINFDVTNKTILDIGGAVGFVGEYLKEQGARIYDVLDVSNWCFRNKLVVVDNFIEADAITELTNLKNNEYDIIISNQFLDCIDDTDLPALIAEMNRVSKTKQWHWVTETIGEDSLPNYNIKTIQDWAIGKGWDSQTSIISVSTRQSVTVL